jgi:GNAT superfamily N-acetyltransferase
VRDAHGLTLHTAAERPDLTERADFANAVWPEYNLHGDVMNAHWGRLGREFADFQFVLADAGEQVVAQGHMIPCRWDGTADGLPGGIDGVIATGALEGADTASALAALVRPDRQGQGLAPLVLQAMRELCRRHGLARLIAPVRPSRKERYPLVPIERYAAWTRADGLPFDPWMRVHARLGGQVLRPEPESLRITGSVAEWESWTGLELPESGVYVFPHGLAPLAVDREDDLARYWEPNVWMVHTAG